MQRYAAHANAHLILTEWGVFPHTETGYKGPFFVRCVLEVTSTMERTTASAHCTDLEIINQAITIIAGAHFCISDEEEFVLIFGGLPILYKFEHLDHHAGSSKKLSC